MSHKPTYEELAAALVEMDDAFGELFSQVCSNPVTNFRGEPVNFRTMNDHRARAHSTIAALRSCGDDRYAYPHLVGKLPPVTLTGAPVKVEDKPKHNLQSYLQQEFNEYNFHDIMLDDMIKQEQRRQGKNESSVDSYSDIREQVEQDLRDAAYNPLDLATLIVGALSRIARGEVNVDE